MISTIRKFLAAGSVALLAACGGGGGSNAPDLATLAKSDPQFSILAEAVAAAGQGSTRAGPNPLTVFALTNAAFAALLGELDLSKAQLLANTARLTSVLTADVPLGSAIATLETGKSLRVGSDLAITDANARRSNITTTDVVTSNGVIHVIDKVILP